MGILKIPGLASGLDTDGLVKTLMSLESRPVTDLTNQRDSMQSEADAWRDVNTRVLTLQNRIQDLNNLTSQSWAAKKSSVTDATVLTVSSTDSTAQVGSYTVQVNSLATATTWQSGQMVDASSNPAPITDPAAQLKISGTIQVVGGAKNGATFTVAATDSLNTIVTNINSHSADLGFTASVSQVNPGDYRIVLKGNNGAANDFSLTDAAGSTAAAQLKLDSATATKIATAADGSMTVNGSTVTFGDNTVKDAIGGLTFGLTKTGTTTVTVNQDQKAVIDAVQKVVDQYNSVMDFIDQQTSYDSKTKKAGTLFGDPRLNDLRDGIRRMLLDPVKGQPDAFNTLNMIGVSTQSFSAGSDYSEKLTLDTGKLTNALNANPDAVRNLFDATDTKNPGVAVRALTYLTNYTKAGGIILGQASAMDKSIDAIKSDINRWNNQILPMREQHLRDQFLQLEKAMSTMQNQGNWLSSQLKSLSGPSSN